MSEILQDQLPQQGPLRLSPSDARRRIGNRLWRIQHLYKIRDKNKNLVNMKFNTAQRQIIQDMKGMVPIRLYDLKYRQGGVSTFFLLFYLDDTIFHANTVSGVLADRKEDLGYLFDIVRLAHANMPTAYQPKLGDDSKSALGFPLINSKMFVSLSIRSVAVHNLHISELAYCKENEVRKSQAACSPKSNISAETTGNGVGNLGFEYFQQGTTQPKTAPFKVRFLPWFIQEEYKQPLNGMAPPVMSADERNLAAMMKKDYNLVLTPEQLLFRRAMQQSQKGLFRQEYPETADDAFLTSGSKYFNSLKIHTLLKEARAYNESKPPLEAEAVRALIGKDATSSPDDCCVWEPPVPGHIYAAGADTSEGKGDPSVLKIIDVTARREVFRYRAWVGPNLFYKVCNEWGRLYNNALLCIERNNHGHAVILGLTESAKYPNLWSQDNETRLAEQVRAGKNLKAPADKELTYGWEQNKVTRPLMLDLFRSSIEGNEADDYIHFAPEYSIRDEQALEECLTFEEVDGKFQAIEGRFDDTIFASALAYQMYIELLPQARRVKDSGGGKTTGIFTLGEREATHLVPQPAE